MPYLAQASIPYFTGIPSDVVTNTFHFEFTGVGAPDDTDYQAMVTALAGFYETIWPDGGGQALAEYCNASGFRVRIYDLSDPAPRVPVYEAVEPLTVEQHTGALNMPPELAVVLSYHGAIVSGTNPARRRGRIYIGGLGDACMAGGSVSTFPAPTSTFRNNLLNAATNLLATEPVIFWQWGVWSVAGQQFTPIVGGWVDNALDTQRRRGNAASQRWVWP